MLIYCYAMLIHQHDSIIPLYHIKLLIIYTLYTVNA